MYDRFLKRRRPAAPAAPLPPPVPDDDVVTDDEGEAPLPRLPLILVQRDPVVASRLAAYLETRHGLVLARGQSSVPQYCEKTLNAAELTAASKLEMAAFVPGHGGDAGALAAEVANDPVLAGVARRCLVLERQSCGVAAVKDIGWAVAHDLDADDAVDADAVYRVVAAPSSLAKRLVAELPERIRLDPGDGATRLLCVAELAGGIYAGTAPLAARPTAAPARTARGRALLLELARRGRLPPLTGNGLAVLVDAPGGCQNFLLSRGDMVASDDADPEFILIKDEDNWPDGWPVTRQVINTGGGSSSPVLIVASGGDGPARAVEVAAPRMKRDCLFVSFVAPRHRASDASLAAELRSELSKRGFASRGAACLHLFANARHERTLWARVVGVADDSSDESREL